ncbi:MAG: hypothetical protein JNL80_11540 [Phycisphaerae bacterium]|nr:hypothetical protein [Phycisphaerae bacterium]
MTLRTRLARTMRSTLPLTLVAPALVGAVSITLSANAPALASPAPVPTPSEDKALPLVAKPKVYVIPMKGQLGTDIHVDIYKKIIEDARKVKPDFIVFDMDSSDLPKSMLLEDPGDRREEWGIMDYDHIRTMVRALREDLGDVPQVMWVEDAFGASSLVALAWPNLYMANQARFGGLGGAIANIKARYSQEDVEAKMVAATAGGILGILEKGGYPTALGEALIYPEQVLSASFEGRKVNFRNDLEGQWLIDTSKDHAVSFRATTAEDVGLSDGNADTFSDLMFLLGYREFEQIDSGQKLFDDYVQDWRRAMEKVREYYNDSQETGGDLKGLQQAKSLLEKALTLLERYPAIEMRLGLPALKVKLDIDRLKEEINGIKRQEKETGRPGGRSGGGGGGRSAPGNGPGSR